ncbi:MAG: glycosyltransferase family 2 protein [Acidimicrobiales bacterium]
MSGAGAGARVAVLVPCHNEEASIARVVTDFAAALPTADIFVYDNASSDDTFGCAVSAGAVVYREPRPGKGRVVRRMFADVDADVYVIVDGDSTYDAAAAPQMIELLRRNRLDMVVGARHPVVGDSGVYRKGHSTGNAAFSRAMRALLGGGFTDIFSGYRVMSRRFVKSFPVQSTGFEIETELSAHAVEVNAACAEVSTAYGSRGGDSASKLRTYRDGTRILLTLLRLFEAMRPLQFFGICFTLLTAVALVLGVPVIGEYARSGLVLRFPTAILAVSVQVIAFLCLASGVILKSVRRSRQEARLLAYLHYPAPPGPDPGPPVADGSRPRDATRRW